MKSNVFLKKENMDALPDLEVEVLLHHSRYEKALDALFTQ